MTDELDGMYSGLYDSVRKVNDMSSGLEYVVDGGNWKEAGDYVVEIIDECSDMLRVIELLRKEDDKID